MIESEIDKAKKNFRLYGKRMLENKEISIHLKEYRKAIEDTWRIMGFYGITETCSKCAEKEPGCCCFQGVETWYSDIQFLTNMLMGVNIPEAPMFDKSCLFVGENGCRLLCRNAFCINFLCDKIKNNISRTDIGKLNHASAKEIDCGIRLENIIINWLSID